MRVTKLLRTLLGRKSPNTIRGRFCFSNFSASSCAMKPFKITRWPLQVSVCFCLIFLLWTTWNIYRRVSLRAAPNMPNFFVHTAALASASWRIFRTQAVASSSAACIASSSLCSVTLNGLAACFSESSTENVSFLFMHLLLVQSGLTDLS